MVQCPGVVQAGGRFGLVAKTPDQFFGRMPPGEHHLDRNQPAQRHVSRFIDDTHAALTKFLQHLVLTDSRPGVLDLRSTLVSEYPGLELVFRGRIKIE